MSACAGCQLPILDRYVYHVLGKAWHQQCLRCSDCQSPMAETCFSRDGLILCKSDFNRRYGTRCSGCDGPLDKDDLVRRAREKVFHVDCFQCSVCHRKLDTGEQLFILNGNRFVCQTDFQSAQTSLSPLTSSTISLPGTITPTTVGTMTTTTPTTPVLSSDTPTPSLNPPTNRTGSNHSNGSECGSDADEENVDGSEDINENENLDGDDSKNDDGTNAKRRGPRTTIKAKQLETLKNAFASTPKPTRHIREQLAQETGLNMRVIQVWFQNRRSKERRMKQLRFGGYRPARRNRNGRDDMCQDVFPHDPFGQTPFGQPPMGFYCGDIYGGGDRPPGALPPPFNLTQEGAPMMPMQEGFDERNSPISMGGMIVPAEYDDDSFRPLPALYAPDIKQHPLPSW